MRIWLLIGIPIVILSLIAVTYCNWSEVKTNFYNYTLTDMLNIVVLLTLSVLISLYSSRFVGNETKKKEIVMSLYESLEKNVHSVYNDGVEYINNSTIRTRQQESKILNLFKQCNIIYNSLNNIHTKYPKICNLDTTIISDILSMKMFLTDTPFGTANIYDAQNLSQFHIDYQNLHKKLCDAKIGTFL